MAVPGGTSRYEVLARLAVPPGTLAPPAGRRPEVVLEAEVAERRLAGVNPQVDRAAAPAVAAVGAAARDVRLAAEGGRPIAAGAGTHPDLDAVEEHQGDSRTADRGTRRPAGPGSGRGG